MLFIIDSMSRQKPAKVLWLRMTARRMAAWVPVVAGTIASAVQRWH